MKTESEVQKKNDFGESLSILIIDDEVEILSLFKTLFESRNFRVVVADQGDSAIKIARQENFSFVLADLKMPGIDGIQLIKLIQKHQPEAKIMVMTGYGKQVQQELEKIGIKDYIVKPIDFDNFFDKLKKMI